VQDLDILLARILREAVALAESRAGAVLLAEKSATGAETLRVAEAIADGVRIRMGETIALDASTVAGEAMISGDAIRLGVEACALAGKGAPPIGIESMLGHAVRSALVVPIVRARDRALGAFVLIDGHSGDAGDGTGFDDDDEQLVGHFASLAAVAVERAQLVRSMILRMIAMAELRDPTETAGHVARVADLSIMLFDAWLLAKGIAEDASSTRARDTLRLGALLHDVGKVGISDAILKKPGKLDDAEFAEMKRHTEIGAQLFAGLRTDFDESAAEVALAHHERWDGRGYPRGLAGESIPLFARIVAVADVFDALSSKRAYKDAWPREKITAFFSEESGKHFDPTLAAILIEHQREAEEIRARHAG
jgi:hypothetical protein